MPNRGNWAAEFGLGYTFPTWVKKPGDHWFVAAFPKIEVGMVEDSLRVDKVTVITTELGEMTQETHTYETSETTGVSKSETDTVTWNTWQEASRTVAASRTQAARARVGLSGVIFRPSI